MKSIPSLCISTNLGQLGLVLRVFKVETSASFMETGRLTESVVEPVKSPANSASLNNPVWYWTVDQLFQALDWAAHPFGECSSHGVRPDQTTHPFTGF
ncbi:hypothetical protein AMTR_s00059p00196680 [Amborella trichopoda]|uniref:Uncharacterized protein n=1 Tax=Amborella trichopoda TaxID=13333 RepID=U5D8C7_AMBTC|nr:hypothetical protein AMTR_s00059p00196680 [Amborella trichopoda]